VAPDTNDLSSIDDNAPDAPRQLRDFAEREAKKAADVPRLLRENAMLKAGVDITTRKGAAFAATYDGDLEDSAAIVADATEFDPTILRAAPDAPSNETNTQGDGTPVNQEPQGTGSQERNALVDGAQPSGAAIENVEQSSIKKAEAAIKSGATVADGIGSMIAERARAAQEGKISTLNRDGTKTTPVA
jgi:hypothetical protein